MAWYVKSVTGENFLALEDSINTAIVELENQGRTPTKVKLAVSDVDKKCGALIIFEESSKLIEGVASGARNKLDEGKPKSFKEHVLQNPEAVKKLMEKIGKGEDGKK